MVIYENNVREHTGNKIIITVATNKNTEFLIKTARAQKTMDFSAGYVFFIKSEQTASKCINTSDNVTYVILIKRNRK